MEKMKLYENVKIEYGGIDYGSLNLTLKNKDVTFNFWFDDLLSDPIPDIVKLLNFVQDGKILGKITNTGAFFRPIVLEFGENDLEFEVDYEKRDLAFQILAWHSTTKKICLDFKIYGKKITFRCFYFRDELTNMLKKILSDLLNDEKFPYFYPLYNRYDDIAFDKIADLIEATVKNIPDLTDKEKHIKADELLLQMMKDDKIELCKSYKIFVEKYKKMLTDYVVPENWFEE